MDEFVTTHRRILIDATIASLKKHGFEAFFCASKAEAVQAILTAAADAVSVGIAGSHSVRALGIVPMLQEAGKTLFDHWQCRPGTSEEVQCRRDQMTADLFLASVNALTMTGEIVNKDGLGNRTNAMTFGPRQVILVAGYNKIVPDLDAAFRRLEEIAAPIRAVSLNRKTPCVSTGTCMDCDSPERICCITSIIHRRPMLTPITVLIVGEELGY